MASVAAQTTKRQVVLERTYKGRPEELWELWTTREGFESWWGPVGFRVEVRRIDPRVGGALEYAMIAATPEMIDAMKQAGQPPSHETRGWFSELEPFRRLALTHRIDFIPGVAPYDSVTVAEFFPEGDRVRMVITLDAMHDPFWTEQATQGWTSQLSKLDQRFGN